PVIGEKDDRLAGTVDDIERDAPRISFLEIGEQGESAGGRQDMSGQLRHRVASLFLGGGGTVRDSQANEERQRHCKIHSSSPLPHSRSPTRSVQYRRASLSSQIWVAFPVFSLQKGKERREGWSPGCALAEQGPTDGAGRVAYFPSPADPTFDEGAGLFHQAT